ncbi:major facilitator superfamily domain-containing protein [Ilyonectria robusta]|uniref:major facilitator superfamily domain-containing protein n=1 Tax=Ilyonectria robusta TaxID=1079257 RepID=UPI001E8E20DF|nr:major facilitator superfamily domain-containing protein [Ilyonectria robusta]KAH8688407.1 major facilitator superfamily domain-containing protein [Ilyonectria robusta]
MLGKDIIDTTPGGVMLVQHEDATDAGVFVLAPTPSSDPNEPLNWSPWRKYLNFGLTMAVSIAAFTNLSIQTIFWQQMVVDMNVSYAQLSNAQSAQLAGLAMGCIFFIPFTIKYGRRSTYIISTALMATVSWWTSRMNSYPELIATAVITGLSGAVNETAVQMTIADLFFVHQRATANACYFTAVMIGSFLTPMAAGSQAAGQGWRWSQYTLSIALTIISVLFLFLFEETKYVPVTFSQGEDTIDPPSPSANGDSKDATDSKGRDVATITVDSNSSIPLNTWRQRLRWTTTTPESLPKLFMMPLYAITLPHVIFTALQFASGVCWLVLYMTVSSIVFTAPPYNFDTAGVGYMTLGPFVGNIFGSIYGGPFSDWFIVKLARRNGGKYEPEMRLHPLIFPMFFMAGGIMMFGITVDRGMHWIYPSIAGAFFAFGLGANGDITFTLVIDTYRELTAEAFVGIAFFRNAVSVAVPFSLTTWMTNMGLTNMWILAGCIAFAIALLYIPMIIWGKRIRTALGPRYWRMVDKRAQI